MTRGERNNNPLNIRHGKSQWRGMRAEQTDPAKKEAVVKFIKYLTDPEHVSELALTSGAMFFVKYEPSPETSLISQKLTQVANDASFTVIHVNGAFPTAFSTEFPAALSALIRRIFASSPGSAFRISSSQGRISSLV